MRKITNEEFIEKLKKVWKDKYTPLTVYVDYNTKIKFRCSECGNVWETIPYVILNKHGCPKCALNKSRSKHSEFVEKINKIHGNKYTFLEDYINNRTKILTRCNDCGYEWYANPKNLLSGSGCTKCANKRLKDKLRKTNEQFLKEIKDKHGDNITILSEYINGQTKVLARCNKCNAEWWVNPRVITINGCTKCGRGTMNNSEFLSKLHNKYGNKFTVMEDIVNNKTLIKFKCNDCGYEFYKSPYLILNQKFGCAKCSGNAPLTHKEFLERVKSSNNGEMPFTFLEEYKSQNQNILCKCNNCGKVFRTLTSYIMHGSGCPERCKIKQMYTEKYKKQINMMYGEQWDISYTEQLDSKDYIKMKCRKCGAEITQEVNRLLNVKKIVCRTCNPTGSKEEIALYDEIAKFYKGKIERNKKFGYSEIRYPTELDFYFPELNLGIEFDGLYWHSAEIKSSGYRRQLTKKNYFKNNYNINVIFIREDEWYLKRDIVIDKLKYLLKSNDVIKVPARKLVVKEVHNTLKDAFLDEYHIQGKDISSVNLGLFTKKGQLASLITFGAVRSRSSFDKENPTVELIRYASKSGYSIQGGFSKLLKHIIPRLKDMGYKYIKTYADRRYSDGNLYINNGFKFSHYSNPNYIYFKGIKTYSRLIFQKHKLKDILDNFDENLSESENMFNNGYGRYYDCGNIVYYYEIK